MQLGETRSVLYHLASETSDSIQCLTFGRDGVLWVGTYGGLYRFDSGRFIAVIPDLWISRIEQARNGHLLVITSKGLVEWNGHEVIGHPDLPGRLGVKSNEIFHVYQDRQGVTWFCTKAGVARQVGNAIEKLAPYDTQSGHEAFRVYEDATGTVWVARSPGLSRVSGNRLEVVVPDLHARYFAFDQEGDVWVGTNGAGLFKIKGRTVQMFGAADGLPGGVPMTVLVSRDGTLWVGSNCGGISSFDGTRFHTYAEKDGLSNSCVFSLAEDNQSNIWVGTYGGGVYSFHDGRFTQFSSPDRLANSVAVAIAPASDGSVWIAYTDGLTRMRNGVTQHFTTADGLSSGRPLAVFEDHRRVVWVETSAGIDHFDGKRFISIAMPPNSFSGEGRFGFGEDQAGGLFAFALWSGTFHVTGNRLSKVYGTPQISGLVKSAQDLWFCGDGIFRAAPDSLHRWEGQREEPRDYTRFGRPDGMNSAECSGGYPNIAMAKKNELWAATELGLAKLDFSRIGHTYRKPAIYMETVIVGKAVETPGPELVVPAGTHHVELHFDAIELSSPERVRLQYRLDDVDREWLDAGATASAVYTGLPIGTHTFHVRACNGDGVWDREGILYTITQQPYYFETNFFRIAVALVLVLLLALAYRLRLRQLGIQMNARLDERVMERTSLARELHDTLLQTIQGSKMVADDALDEPLDSNRMQRALERVSIWLARATEEGRAALSAMRASTAQANDLADAFRRAREECACDVSLVFEVIVDGSARDMHPIVRDDIYRIGYEAIRNACAHSKATKLGVELTYGHDFVLHVRDNGLGIAKDILTRGKDKHFGLQGMQERSERIGASLSFHLTTPGTDVELLVPGKTAYRTKRATPSGSCGI